MSQESCRANKHQPIIYGCMNLALHWNFEELPPATITQGVQLLHGVLERGIRHFDHADIYCRGKSEELFSHFLKEVDRESVFIQSKCGIILPDEQGKGACYDFSKEHILSAVEASLCRLKVEYLDLLLLHRPDPLCQREEVASVLEDLFQSGKVHRFGFSNHTQAQIESLQEVCSLKLEVNQLEFSALHTDLLEGALVGDAFELRSAGLAGTAEFCVRKNIELQAWSPLAKGYMLGAKIPKSKSEHYLSCCKKLERVLKEIGEELSIPPAGVALAWVLRSPWNIRPVVGTRNLNRLDDALTGVGVKLSRDQWTRIFVAGRGKYLP